MIKTENIYVNGRALPLDARDNDTEQRDFDRQLCVRFLLRRPLLRLHTPHGSSDFIGH